MHIPMFNLEDANLQNTALVITFLSEEDAYKLQSLSKPTVHLLSYCKIPLYNIFVFLKHNFIKIQRKRSFI